jgi:hypothetical protein
MHMPYPTIWSAVANAEGEETMQNQGRTASKHYLKPRQTRMKHQMTLEEANEQKRRAGMHPVGIWQQNKICDDKDERPLARLGAQTLNNPHISKCLYPSTSPSLILDGTAQTGR